MRDSALSPLVATALTRRDFLCRAAAGTLPFVYLAGQRLPLWADDAPKGKAGPKLIVREKEPINLEFPFSSLDGFITPNDLFYVRNHFPMPKLEPRTWKLKVEGAVERHLTLDLDALTRMPSRTQTATLECAGNGRGFLTPKAGGVQWQLGAVSNAEWTGVPLAAVLERAGLKSGAVEVVLEGADKGDVKVPQKPKGETPFARSLPLAKARAAEVVLAYRMNGKPLPAEHGFPLRVVVPGWYGVASIKWLTRLVVTDRPFRGFFQTIDYTYWRRVEGLPTLTPITELEIHAEIAQPAAGDKLAAGKDHRLFGAAWAGAGGVRRVRVSVDGGKHWEQAQLLGKPVPFAWRLWQYTWRRPAAGNYLLMAQAQDRRGHRQPLERDPDRRNYMINHVVAVPVTVATTA